MHQLRGVFGIMAFQSFSEPSHDLFAEPGGQFLARPFAVQRIGTDERDLFLGDTAGRQLRQHALHGQSADRPVRRDCRIMNAISTRLDGRTSSPIRGMPSGCSSAARTASASSAAGAMRAFG